MSKSDPSLRRWLSALLLAVVVMPAAGCRTLREIAALRRLDFGIAGAADPRLAGIDLSRIQSSGEVSPADMLRLGSAVLKEQLNLDVTLLVSAKNPAENTVDARVVRLDWTLLLDDRETVSGVTDSDILIQPGTEADVPVAVSVNLVEFFDTGIRDLLDLALDVSGVGGRPTRVTLRATPTVDTVLGPIRYPHPITIASVNSGG